MTHSFRQDRGQSERGTALVGVLLLLMMMSAIAAALGVSGQTETLIVRNHQTAAQARAAAEAGINHAAQELIVWLAAWPNSYANVNVAIDDLIDDPSDPPTGITFAFGGTNEVNGDATVTYVVDLMDEDDPARGDAETTLEDDEDTTNDENGIATDDNNRSFVLRSTGTVTYGDGAASTAVVEAVITPLKLPAIISGGDLDVGASVTVVAGDNGGIHTNGALDFTGSNVITGIDSTTGLPDLANGTATASGTYDNGNTVATGAFGDGYAVKPVPSVDASFYQSWADYVVTDVITCNRTAGCPDGSAYNTTACDPGGGNGNDCQDDFGWVYDNPGWRMMATGKTNPPYAEATFYFTTPVELQQGGSVADPLNITVIAEGSIDVSGNVNVTPGNTELLFVTDGDLEISGNMNMPLAEGQILVHEQVNIHSSAAVILGQLVIEDAEDSDPFVTRDTDGIQGVTITYTGDVGNTMFYITGWREVR